MTGTSTAGVAWPQDVIAFASAKGVANCLTRVVEITRRIFTNAEHLEVFVESDWEIADESYLVFRIAVPGWDVPRAVEAQKQWVREVQDCVPARPGPFVLSLEMDG